MLGCDHLAHDAVQECLVTLWQHTKQFGSPPNLGAWLTRTLRNRAKHLLRTARRRQHHEHTASEHCRLHDGCDNPLHVAIAHEIGERLEHAIRDLPASQREAYLLFEQTGLDYQSIADDLQLPIGTVRSRLARARAALQDTLAKSLDGS